MWAEFECRGCRVSVNEPAGGSENVVYIIASGAMDKAARLLYTAGHSVVAVQCRDWYGDLSPWPAPGVYNDTGDFKGGAGEFLAFLCADVLPRAEALLSVRPCRRCIAGYSMGGLFALWTAYNCDLFSHICSGSGAVWYEGWTEYAAANRPAATQPRFYLSVGRREKKTRNLRMAKVVQNTQLTADILADQGYDVHFELNEGGHFSDPVGRLVKGIRYLLEDAAV